MPDSEKNDERTLTIDELFEARNDPDAEEMPAHPKNKYEIAPGVVTAIKTPTFGLGRKFDACFNRLSDMLATEDDVEGDEAKKAAMQDPNQVALKDGYTVRDFRELNREIAAEQANLVLELDQPLDPDDMVEPMAYVVQDHFTMLCRGAARRQSG